MTYLHSLRLCDLPNLESLPDCFGKLCLLHHLSIDYSSKLRYLPKSLSLSNLKHLHIASCPLLEKRYWKHKGEDWQKIGHIPKIDVIRRGDVYYDLGAGIFWILLPYIYIYLQITLPFHAGLFNVFLQTISMCKSNLVGVLKIHRIKFVIFTIF